MLYYLVFSIASYGSECWALKESDKKWIEGFELWCYRRVLRISWTTETSNEDVLKKVQPHSKRLDSILQRELGLFGHSLREENRIGRALLLGSVYEPRGRGRPKTQFIEDVVKVCGGVCAAVEMARDKDRWRIFAKEAMVDGARSSSSW